MILQAFLVILFLECHVLVRDIQMPCHYQRYLYLVVNHTVGSKLLQQCREMGPYIIDGVAAYTVTQFGCMLHGATVLQVPPKHQQAGKMVY